LLAKAHVIDPCFWTPDLPAIYDVTINLVRGNKTVATSRREIGLRSLRAEHNGLLLGGKRWILRGVQDVSTTAELPRHWHAAAAAYMAAAPADERLAEASQWGSLTVVSVEADAQITADLRRLAAQPGVAIVVISGKVPATIEPRQVAPNLLLAAPADAHNLPVPTWAHLIWAAAHDSDDIAMLKASWHLPIIAVRPLPHRLPIEEARAECDRLQRDLAPIGQFAGYVV
jgi:hypothetical protein